MLDLPQPQDLLSLKSHLEEQDESNIHISENDKIDWTGVQEGDEPAIIKLCEEILIEALLSEQHEDTFLAIEMKHRKVLLARLRQEDGELDELDDLRRQVASLESEKRILKESLSEMREHAQALASELDEARVPPEAAPVLDASPDVE